LTRLNLVVLRALDPAIVTPIYEALGCKFETEQHGNGPRHFSSTVGGLVLEIYPRAPDEEGTTAVRLGFVVDDLDRVLNAAVAAGGRIVSHAKQTQWGRRAVLIDTEGHKLELSEAT